MTDRKKLFDAALEIFAEVGLKNASLQMISEKAGLEPAMARALFVDKETLLREVLDDISMPVISAISMAVERYDTPRDMICGSLRLFDTWLNDNPLYVRVLQRAFLDDPAALRTIFKKSMYSSEFYERIEGYIAEGKLSIEDPFDLVMLLDSAIMFGHIAKAGMASMIPGTDETEIITRRFNALCVLLENGLFVE